MSLKALIFDLDGTLIDSAPDLRTACNKVLEKHHRRPISIEETMKFVGNGAAKLMERAFRATGPAPTSDEVDTLCAEFLAFYDGHEADETDLYEGVRDSLHIIKTQGWRLALCTNKPQAPTLNLLRALELDHFFEVVLGGDQLERKKPDPQMLFHVLEKLGLESAEAIMVGDSPNDICAAQNAQMKNIAVSYGYRKVPVQDLGADLVIDHFSELPTLLCELKG